MEHLGSGSGGNSIFQSLSTPGEFVYCKETLEDNTGVCFYWLHLNMHLFLCFIYFLYLFMFFVYMVHWGNEGVRQRFAVFRRSPVCYILDLNPKHSFISSSATKLGGGTFSWNPDQQTNLTRRLWTFSSESVLLLGGIDGDNAHGAMLTSVEQVRPTETGWKHNKKDKVQIKHS